MEGRWVEVMASADVTRTPRRAVADGVVLAVWRGPRDRPVVFLDSCPHKAYPLSTGRRTWRGRLVCEAHDWEFDASGRCVRIPGRAPDPQRHATALTCREEGGRLWVLLPPPADAAAHAPDGA